MLKVFPEKLSIHAHKINWLINWSLSILVSRFSDENHFLRDQIYLPCLFIYSFKIQP